MKRYLKTVEMAEYISVSKKWLLEKRDKEFIKGVHYFELKENLFRWDKIAIDKWLKEKSKDNKVEDIISKITV